MKKSNYLSPELPRLWQLKYALPSRCKPIILHKHSVNICCTATLQKTQSCFSDMRRLLELPLQLEKAAFYFQIRVCCQSKLCRCGFILLEDLELKISFFKEMNGTCSTEAIRKGLV
jgi:hypothetical protein